MNRLKALPPVEEMSDRKPGGWRRAVLSAGALLMLAASALAQTATGAVPAAEAKARAIVLPSMTLQNASLTESLDFLRAKGGVNIVLVAPAKQGPTISLSLTNIPLFDAVRYVAQLSDLELTADEHALTVAPGYAPAAKAAAPALALAKAKGIIIPTVEFRDASLADAVGYLRMKAQQLDPEKKGVNILVKPTPASSEARLSLSLKNVPLSEALRYAAQLSNLEMTADDQALLLAPAAAAAGK